MLVMTFALLYKAVFAMNDIGYRRSAHSLARFMLYV